MADPFSQLYDRIVKVLKDYSDQKYRVLDWNSVRSPQPDVASTSDMPEWQVRPTGGNYTIGGRSCASECVRDFSLTMTTGVLILGKHMLPGEWALHKALYAMQYGALDSLKWEDRSFVERVEVTGIIAGITDPTVERQIKGWASQWTIRTYLSFSNSDLTGASP